MKLKNEIKMTLHNVSFDRWQLTNQDTYSSTAGYSGNRYNISSALKNGIVYPAKDPSIFEVKYLNSDIKGKVLGDNLGTGE